MNKIFKIAFIICAILIASNSHAQCGTANLSSDDTVICIPQIVKFKMNNFPAGTTFEWNLGSGYISADSNYTNLFTASGNYTIIVRMTYKDASTCTITKTNFMQAYASPIVKINVSKSIVCSGNDSVILTDNASKSKTRDWLLNNTLYKNTPKNFKVLYTYPSGFKNATIFLKDSFGCNAKKTIDSVVFVSDSVNINFMADKLTGCIPKSVNFTNTTDSLTNNIASCNWTFQNGVPGTSVLKNPKNIIFNTKDSFDITLRVTTKKGCIYSLRKNNYLMYADSLILNNTFSKTSLCGGELLTLNLNNSRSANPTVVIAPANYVFNQNLPQTKVIKFNALGSYSFSITDDINGCISERKYSNNVSVSGPIALMAFATNKGCALPDTFLGYNSSLVGSGIGLSQRWDLYYDTATNSIQNSTANPFKVILNAKGKYTVRLIATGSNGCVDSIIQKTAIEIVNIKPQFSWDPNPACPGDIVNFTNSTPVGSSKSPNLYQWTFYKLNNTILARDTVRNPKVKYVDTGNYTVKLAAYNKVGCKDSITYIKRIQVQPPKPIFELKDTNICTTQFSRLKVKYKDSTYYKNYWHVWLIQHKDSANFNFRLLGDSVFPSGLWPGKYSITYITFSKLNSCFDTFKLKTQIWVSGARYQMFVDPVKGCNPFVSSVNAKQLQSFNLKNNSTNPILTNWTQFNDTNTLTIAKRNNLISNVLVKKPGYFSFRFSYYHPSGCNDSFFLGQINSGVKAGFYSATYGCVAKKIKFTNNSDPDAIAFKWFIKDSINGFNILPSDTTKNIDIFFTQKGTFKVGIVAYGKGQCTDTFLSTVIVNDIRARFISMDTFNFCAPIIATVSAITSPDIFNYKWYLGDGDSIVNNLSTFSHLYNKNTGPIGSDVKLIVAGNGCNDTLEKKGYIKVIGPIPKFSLTNFIGCEKLKVKFNNQSLYYKRFFMEYGDGSVLDSINLNTHIYKINDRSLSSQVFKTRLSVIDSFGCLVSFVPSDSVTVLRSPEVNFSVNNDTGCAQLLVSFRNLTVGAVSYKWDFDGDGKIDNLTAFPKFYYTVGDFKPMLIAKASNGCEDTLRNTVFIKSYAQPNVTVTSNLDTICYNNSVSFTANNAPSNLDIKKWNWDFGNPNSNKDSSTKQNPVFNFQNILVNQVSLVVVDIHNCLDTFNKLIYLYDTIGPKSDPINYVTISNNSDVLINWPKSKYSRFSSYNLYRDFSGFTNFFTSTNVKDTSYIVNSGLDVNNLSYCYTINITDNCNIQGAPLQAHCTMLLTVIDTGINQLNLAWLAYNGWDKGALKGVERYRIYRKIGSGPYKLLDSTVNTFYVDDSLCPNVYCYYIEALQKNGIWKSLSNEACKTPKYIKPSIPVIPISTSVNSFSNTYTKWQPYTGVKNLRRYIISRYYQGTSLDDYYAYSDSAGFIDDKLDVFTNRESYTYTIRAEDHCGNLTKPSSISKTILLTGQSVNYVAQIRWTPYAKWHSGVKQYQIFIRQNGTFQYLAFVDSSKKVYDFDYLDSKLNDSLCFKIRAIKDTLGQTIESFSNIVCMVSEPQLWVPNVFSPNRNGYNEVFIPRAVLIFNNTGNPILDYNLQIFNRWGEMVFETSDATVGWDGNYKDKPCQEGHYVYKIKALGLDGVKNFNLEGVLTLLR